MELLEKLPSSASNLSSGVARLAVVGDCFVDVICASNLRTIFAGQSESRNMMKVGGTAANIASRVAEEAVPVDFFGRAGNDLVGEFVLGRLLDTGVGLKCIREGNSGFIVCLETPRGLQFLVDVEPPRPRLHEVRGLQPSEYSWIHLTGHWLLDIVQSSEPIGGLSEMFTVGRKHDQTRLSIDLANSTRITSVGVAAIRELINDLEPDVVFASSKETSQLDSHLQYLGSAALIVTNGGRSVNISKGATTIEVPVATVSTRRATTGAGDAFIAVSLCQLLANASVVTAVEAGVQAATELVAQTNLFGIGGS